MTLIRANSYHRTAWAFILFLNKTSSTSSVSADFRNEMKNLSDKIFLSNDVHLVLQAEESRIYDDTEYTVCNVSTDDSCDQETTYCSAKDGIPFCSCKEGYVPWLVEYRACKDNDECQSDESVCGQHGTCRNTLGNYTCQCKPGYRFQFGIGCTDTCIPNPCKNGGSCHHGDREDSYTCHCTNDWVGPDCERENEEAARMQQIAIAVGASVGALCLVLLVVSCCLFRRYVISKAQYEKLGGHKHLAESTQTIEIPRAKFRKDIQSEIYYRDDSLTTGGQDGYELPGQMQSFTNGAYAGINDEDDQSSSTDSSSARRKGMSDNPELPPYTGELNYQRPGYLMHRL